MNWIFEIKDASERKIHLSKERWAHIQKHKLMVLQIENIKESLQKPDVITPFEDDTEVSFYYKYFKERKAYLFVSVKYLNGDGFIITSFFTDKIT